MSDIYSVHWVDPEGTFHDEFRAVDAATAVAKAFSLTTRPAALMGIIRRVIVVDTLDCCCFEWVSGKGVTDGHTHRSDIQRALFQHIRRRITHGP